MHSYDTPALQKGYPNCYRGLASACVMNRIAIGGKNLLLNNPQY